MAFDAAIGEMVLFGGLDAATGKMDGDTWTWNGKRWKARPRQESDPLPRATATMVYDAAHKVVVLRGGIDNASRSLDDTWTWDATRWTQMAPVQSPPIWTTDFEPMVWDSSRSRVLLFAMLTNPYLKWDVPADNQLWSWDGTTWTMLHISGAPSGHEHWDGTMVYDTSRGQVVLFAHADQFAPTATSTRLVATAAPTTWTFDGTSWRMVSTTGPVVDAADVASRIIAPDDARGDIVMLDVKLNTWTWDGSQWNLRAPAHAPAGDLRLGAAVAYDPVRRVVVLFGGQRQFGSNPDGNDTWTWNGADWAQVA